MLRGGVWGYDVMGVGLLEVVEVVEVVVLVGLG